MGVGREPDYGGETLTRPGLFLATRTPTHHTVCHRSTPAPGVSWRHGPSNRSRVDTLRDGSERHRAAAIRPLRLAVGSTPSAGLPWHRPNPLHRRGPRRDPRRPRGAQGRRTDPRSIPGPRALSGSRAGGDRPRDRHSDPLPRAPGVVLDQPFHCVAPARPVRRGRRSVRAGRDPAACRPGSFRTCCWRSCGIRPC